MSPAPASPSPPARPAAGPTNAGHAASRAASARPGVPGAGGAGNAFASLLADQLAADPQGPVAPPPSTEPVAPTEAASARAPEPPPADAQAQTQTTSDAAPTAPPAALAATVPSADRAPAAPTDADAGSDASAGTAAALPKAEPTIASGPAAPKAAATAADPHATHGLTADASAARPGIHPDAAGGEHQLTDPGWRAAEALREAAPAAPISPSADGALPSLLAPGEATAPTATHHATEAADAAPTPPQAHLPQEPGSEAFTLALGQQVRTWLRGGVGHARLSLNPAELGPIDVRIAVNGGRADVQLAAAVPSTREALAQALPLLTQQLDGAGLTLGGSDVRDGRQPGAQARGDEPGRAGQPAATGTPATEAAAAQALAALTQPLAPARGLLDLYA